MKTHPVPNFRAQAEALSAQLVEYGIYYDAAKVARMAEVLRAPKAIPNRSACGPQNFLRNLSKGKS